MAIVRKRRGRLVRGVAGILGVRGVRGIGDYVTPGNQPPFRQQWNGLSGCGLGDGMGDSGTTDGTFNSVTSEGSSTTTLSTSGGYVGAPVSIPSSPVTDTNPGSLYGGNLSTSSGSSSSSSSNNIFTDVMAGAATGFNDAFSVLKLLNPIPANTTEETITNPNGTTSTYISNVPGATAPTLSNLTSGSGGLLVLLLLGGVAFAIFAEGK